MKVGVLTSFFVAISSVSFGVVTEGNPLTIRSSGANALAVTIDGAVAQDLYEAGDAAHGAKDGAVSMGLVRCTKTNSAPKKIPGLPEGGLAPMTTYSCIMKVDKLTVQDTVIKPQPR